MAVLAYNEITPKKVIIFNDEPCIVISHHVFRKQQRKPVNITKLKGLKSGRAYENTFHVNETADEAELESKQIVFIYRKGDEYMFHMAGTPAERFSLSADLIGDGGKYIKERSELDAMIYDEEVIGVRVPIKVELKVTQAMEAVKGNSSGGALKEVTLETGATMMVPMFIGEGDVIAINTESGLYAERVSKS